MIGKFDIKVARQIHRDNIADARKALFEKNDLAIRDAQISGDADALKEAVARRDELRSIGDKIDAAKNIDALLAIKVE